MRRTCYALTVAFALYGSLGSAAAQSATGSTNVLLSPPEAQSLAQALESQPASNAPSGFDPQIGGTLPDGMPHQPVPQDVAARVPDAARLHYSKLADRILWVDPNNTMVVEIIPTDRATMTGHGSAAGNAPEASGSSPRR
jgi:hypothetical protein